MKSKDSEIFSDEILDALPANDEIKRGVGLAKRSQNPNWIENVRKNSKTKETHPEWHAKITKLNQTRKDRYGEEYSLKLSKGQTQRYANLTQEEKKVISDQAKDLWRNTEYRQKMMEYYNTPEYKAYIKNRNKEVAARPEMQEWYKEFNKSKPKDPEYMKRLQKGIDKRTASEDWIRKNCRPVKCPYGIFPVVKHATLEYQKEYGGELHSLSVKIRSWLKSDNKPEWQYLTWEEYDKLIGKDS